MYNLPLLHSGLGVTGTNRLAARRGRARLRCLAPFLFRAEGSGHGVQGLGLRAECWGLGVRSLGSGFWVEGSGCLAPFLFRVEGSGHGVQGLGLRGES